MRPLINNSGKTGFFEEKFVMSLLYEVGKEELIPTIENLSDLQDAEFQYVVAQLSIAVAIDKYSNVPGDVEVFRRFVPNKETGKLEEKSFIVDLSDKDEKDFLFIIESDLDNFKEVGEFDKLVMFLDKLCG